MKHFLKNILTLSFFSLLLFISCKKEYSFEHNTGGSGTGYQPNIKSTIKLLVVNEFGAAVTKAKVEVGNTLVYTNELGFAVLKDIPVIADKALVKVNAEGYFEAYRTFAIDSNECYGKIKLELYKLSGTVESATGGTVNISAESSVSFTGNTFALASNGTDYNGTVNVYATYLNPVQNDFNLLIPGDLVAEDNGDAVLHSFGMLNVEIRSASGEQLKLKPNSSAALKALIPSDRLAAAPQSIPMWYFDTNKGVWIKDGTAAKQANYYNAQVSHFTRWNYDVAYPRLFISGIVTDSTGLPIVNSQVLMSVTSFDGPVIYAYTNNQGYFRIPAPYNANCTISIAGQGCNTSFFSLPVITKTNDISLGSFKATNYLLNHFIVNGNFLNCTNQAVQSGSLKVYTENNIFEGQIINGQVNIFFPICKDSVDALFVAEDQTTQKVSITSKKLYKNVVSNLGNMNICDTNSKYFIRYIVDNQMFYIPASTDDRFYSYYFNSTPQWVQVAHAGLSNSARISININGLGLASPVSMLGIKEFPNLSNVGNNINITNYFAEKYTWTPGSNIKGTAKGKMFDTGIGQWRNIDIVYSVVQW